MIALKHKIKNNDLAQVQNLNMWGHEIDNIHLVREMSSLETVSLSHNNISTLRDLAHCQNIKELYIRKNGIKDL